MIKMTIEISKKDYRILTNNLHHGQKTQIIRAFINDLAKRIEAGEKIEVMEWIYGRSPITIDPIKDIL